MNHNIEDNPEINEREIVSLTNPKSPIAEAYHTLRTNILFAGMDNPIKSVLVTSPLPKSGKSTTVANLGVTIARTGSRVLIVDADMRRPTQHHIFQLDNKVGLTSLLVEAELEIEEVVKETRLDNLYILNCGPLPPNPSELIVSRTFSALIDKLKEKYDFLLIDSPPVIAVTDPALLSRFVEGTILIVDFGNVTRDAAQKAKEQLTNVKANILGVVLNKIPSNGHGYYYYYYYRYYGEGADRTRTRGRGKKSRSKERGLSNWFSSLFKRG